MTQKTKPTYKFVYHLRKLDIEITSEGLLNRVKRNALLKIRDTTYGNLLKMLCDAENLNYSQYKHDAQVEIFKRGSKEKCDRYITEFKTGKWHKAQDFWNEIKAKIMFLRRSGISSKKLQTQDIKKYPTFESICASMLMLYVYFDVYVEEITDA
jgi:hypothetical protein